MTVLLVDLLFELFNQLLLVGDDLRAGRLLCLNVLLLTKNLIVSKSVIAPEVQREKYSHITSGVLDLSDLPRQALYNLPFLPAPASSSLFRHSSCATG